MSIKSKINHFLHPIQGEIWCLHRIIPERSQFPSNRELEVTPDYLEGLIVRYRRQRYRFVNIDEIISDIKHDFWDLRQKKRVNISFDDGYCDVYDYAFPIFKKYNIPFTIYLVGNFPLGTSDLWWIQLEQLVKGDNVTFENLMKRIYQSDKNMRDLMHDITTSNPDFQLCKALTLSWGQLSEMIESGLCTIGCHTMTHPGLTRIPESEILYELTESKRVIESHLHISIKHFSYPHSMENHVIQELLKKTGYETATMGYGGTIRKGDNLYKINRRYIVQP